MGTGESFEMTRCIDYPDGGLYAEKLIERWPSGLVCEAEGYMQYEDGRVTARFYCEKDEKGKIVYSEQDFVGCWT